MSRFSEAEPYARIAYRRSPDNPYIIDVLIEALEGKARQGLSVDTREIQDLYDQLEAVCMAGGTQFYKIRQARRLYAVDRDKVAAFSKINEAVSKSDDNDDRTHGIYSRAEMSIRANDFRNARSDINELKEMNPEARRLADVLDVRCLIAEGQFPEAKRFLDTYFKKSRRLAEVLEKELARSLAFAPEGQPTELLEWAKAKRS